MKQVTRILLLLMAFGAMIAAAFLSMGYAHADPSDLDQQFIAFMQRDGIDSDAGYSGLIAAGHQICGARMQGYTENSVISVVYRESQLTTVSKAAALVRDAEMVYCPGYYGSAA